MNRRIKKKKEKQRLEKIELQRQQVIESMGLLCLIAPQVAKAWGEVMLAIINKIESIVNSIDWEYVADKLIRLLKEGNNNTDE